MNLGAAGRMYEVFRALPSADWHLVFFFFPFLNASATLLVNYVTSCGKYLVVPLCMCVLMFPTTFLYKQNHGQKMCMEFPTVVASPGPDGSFLCLLEAVVTPGAWFSTGISQQKVTCDAFSGLLSPCKDVPDQETSRRFCSSAS